jgi:hypothetical protein
VAIVGVNRIAERPVVHAGQIAIRKMMNLSSSFDHRIVDGHVGAAFAYEIRGCGENPEVYAIGTPARRSARSKARPKSRWLVNRARPRLA